MYRLRATLPRIFHFRVVEKPYILQLYEGRKSNTTLVLFQITIHNGSALNAF